jgi:hypothetical protein
MSKTVDANTAALKVTDKKVENIRTELKKKDEKTEKLIKQGEHSVYEEMRKRETRRLNVVFFGIPELNERGATGQEKLDWDKQSCFNVFNALEVDLGDKSIKFCRRVGEKGDRPRPVVMGFWTEAERALLLRNVKRLEKTMFSDISVAPDLTKIQREEEKEMQKEAERRTAQLSKEDKAKNLQWLVVGNRGEKRFVKAVPQDPHLKRGGITTRGRGTWGTRGGARGRTSGANSTPIVRRPTPAQATTAPQGSQAEKEKEQVSETDTETETETEAETESEMETEMETGDRERSAVEKTTVRRKQKGSGSRATDAPPKKR